MNANVHSTMPVHGSGPAPETAGVVTILIHGRTQSPTDMFLIAERIGLPDMPYLAVEAFEKSWYPDKFMAPLENNQPHLDMALTSLDTLVKSLLERDISPENIAFVGFSQGACLAAEYVYRHPRRWGGLIAYTGGLIGPEATVWGTTGYLAGTPVLLANSDVDTWVPLSRTEQTREVLNAMGGAVSLHVYAGMGHEVNDEEISLGRKILEALIASKEENQWPH